MPSVLRRADLFGSKPLSHHHVCKADTPFLSRIHDETLVATNGHGYALEVRTEDGRPMPLDRRDVIAEGLDQDGRPLARTLVQTGALALFQLADQEVDGLIDQALENKLTVAELRLARDHLAATAQKPTSQPIAGRHRHPARILPVGELHRAVPGRLGAGLLPFSCYKSSRAQSKKYSKVFLPHGRA